MPHPAVVRWSTLCLTLLLGCANEGTVSVKLSGTGQRPGTPEVFEVSETFASGHHETPPDYNAPSNAHTATYGPVDLGDLGLTTLTLYLPAPRLGAFDGQVALKAFEGNGPAIMGNARGRVTTLRITGSASHPVEVAGTFEAATLANAIPGNEIAASDGEFEYRPLCDDSVAASRWFGYCGSAVADDYAATFTPG